VKLIIIKRKTLIVLIILLILSILFAVTLRFSSKKVFKYLDPIYKGNETNKKVAFACNVVWGNEYLPDILSEFKKNDIKISFFFGGDWINKNNELFLSIYKDGHEIGNHGYNHLKHTQINKDKNIDEILKTEKVIKELSGVKTDLFAPPYGDVNKTVTEIAESLGYRVIMWSIDTIDWNTKDPNIVLDRVNKKIHNPC
jgi:peptidoglycan/xylan/chitin deacetylase (PgdA/CDA1 family)